jgi:hypothetical protein
MNNFFDDSQLPWYLTDGLLDHAEKKPYQFGQPSTFDPYLEKRMQPMTVNPITGKSLQTPVNNLDNPYAKPELDINRIAAKAIGLPVDPKLSPSVEKEKPSWMQQNHTQLANEIIGGIGIIGKIKGDQNNEQSYNDMMQRNGNTDVTYDQYPVNENPYGDYTTNRGQGQNFQPGKMTYAQNSGNNFQYKDGGEYEMTDGELKQFLEAGGEVDYL